MLNEIFYNIVATIVIGFVSLFFWHFPKYRGYVVMITTTIIGILAVFLIEPHYRILIWGITVLMGPLVLLMIYYVFAGSSSVYGLSFAFGHIASILILWLMAAGGISYEMGYSAAADGEAYRKLQNDFEAYRADSSKALDEQKKAVSELQKRLEVEQLIRTELEAELTAKEKINSDDVIRLKDVMHTLFFVNTDSTEYLNYYYEHALKIFQEEAGKGNIEASFLTGYILDPLHTRVKADGITQNADSAIQNYEYAASRGNVDAQYLLGNLYYSVKGDKKQAAKYYRLAADKGHKQAQEMITRIDSKN